MTSDLVMPRHLCRKAVIYIRQSTPHQVLSNQESLRLQYALRQRAHDLGWNNADVEVIDADLGQSDWLVNYGERHRAGLRVGMALTEGTANFLVNRRMAKSQQMRWVLPHFRCRWGVVGACQIGRR